MMKLLLKFFSWVFIVLGAGLVLATLGQWGDPKVERSIVQVLIVGVLLCVGGISLRQCNKNEGKPAYSTKNCPKCGERLPLDAEKCEYCGSKQKKGDNTCSGGDTTATDARRTFAAERRQAKRMGSTHYTWRSIRDGARCERCANNEGKIFAWDEEPPGGHAGATPRCRCYPAAVIPGCKAHEPQHLTHWEKAQQDQEPKHRAIAETALQVIRQIFVDKALGERLYLRAFWGKYHVVLDNDVTKALVSLEFRDDHVKAVFYAKPGESPRNGGSRRVSLGDIGELATHRPKLDAALAKYL